MIKYSKIILMATCLPFHSWAGVYKCVEASGETHYQSSPCTDKAQAVQINTKTGSKVDLTALEIQERQAAEQKQRQEAAQKAEQQAHLDAIAQRKNLVHAQHELTQAMIKQNPMQFSAYAIPPYEPDDLPTLVKSFEERLPDIEKFRRLAAQKALANGQCQRVEADELSSKSTKEQLIIMISCSSGQTFYYDESQLTE